MPRRHHQGNLGGPSESQYFANAQGNKNYLGYFKCFLGACHHCSGRFWADSKNSSLNCYPIGRTAVDSRENILMSRTRVVTDPEKRRTREERLGFRVDARTKKLVERAAALERRSLTEFCLTALTEATRTTIARHETIGLSERDREAFFDALVHPPKPNARLRPAFQSAQRQIAR